MGPLEADDGRAGTQSSEGRLTLLQYGVRPLRPQHAVSGRRFTMPKGQQGKKKDNKPKLSTADKQKKKKEKEAKKK